MTPTEERTSHIFYLVAVKSRFYVGRKRDKKKTIRGNLPGGAGVGGEGGNLEGVKERKKFPKKTHTTPRSGFFGTKGKLRAIAKQNFPFVCVFLKTFLKTFLGVAKTLDL